MSETLQETYTRLVPASRAPTREQQLRYLQLREEGLTHTRAARSVGSTGKRFRSLLRRDPEFKALYEELVPDFETALQDRVRNELSERAFDRRDPQSARLLVLLAEARLPELDYKRTRRIDQHTTMEQHLTIDPRDFTLEEIERMIEIIENRSQVKTIADAEVVREIGEGAA